MANVTSSTAVGTPVNVASLGITAANDKAVIYDVRARGPVWVVRWMDGKEPRYADMTNAADVEVAS